MSSIVSTSHELSKLQNTFCGQTTEYCALRVKNTPHLRLIQSLRTQRPCHTSSKAWCLSMAGASPFFNFYTFFTCLDYIAMTKIMRQLYREYAEFHPDTWQRCVAGFTPRPVRRRRGGGSEWSRPVPRTLSDETLRLPIIEVSSQFSCTA
jgi:hypothetical protein